MRRSGQLLVRTGWAAHGYVKVSTARGKELGSETWLEEARTQGRCTYLRQ